MKDSKCVVCGITFKEGDMVQCFLRSPDNPNGSWTKPVKVDTQFQARIARNNDKLSRRHSHCTGEQ